MRNALKGREAFGIRADICKVAIVSKFRVRTEEASEFEGFGAFSRFVIGST